MRILLLSRYDRLGASSRLRHYQYLPRLKALGLDVEAAPLLPDAYLKALYARRRLPLAAIAAGYLGRIRRLFQTRRFDLLWIEKELFPWLPRWFECSLRRWAPPIVIDIDDAWYLRYDAHRWGLVRMMLGGKLDRVMGDAALVVAGSRVLAEHVLAVGATRVALLPTVVDTARYPVVPRPGTGCGGVRRRPLVVGWIGSPATATNLDLLVGVLSRAVADGTVSVRLIGAGDRALASVPCTRVPWSEEHEAAEIGHVDVGIMPLADTPWTRGKCGYKLVQYMACGRPVIASPVGANHDIVCDSVDGLLAETEADWAHALARLAADPELCRRMGAAGRAKVERLYSLGSAAPRLAELLRMAASSPGPGPSRCLF